MPNNGQHNDKRVEKKPNETPSKFQPEYKKIYNNALEVVGCTPIVKLNVIPKQEKLNCNLYTKMEFVNPGGSIKDRIALNMIEKAEEAGIIVKGKSVIIEPTSGNTGIGLAFACAIKGYRCILVMPEKNSNEKVDTLLVLGAEVVKTPNVAAKDPESDINVAHRLAKEINNGIVLDQFSNKDNPQAHYEHTAEEILWSMDGKLDMVVFGAGTGGTATGIAKKIKERCPDCITVGIDPYGSYLALPDSLNKTDIKYFEVEGIGDDFVPAVLDRSYIDEWVKTDDRDAFMTARRLMKDEGILCGGSGGAALWGAIHAARGHHLTAEQKCLVILPDGMRNYMTKFVTNQWMEARKFYDIPHPNQNSVWWNDKLCSTMYRKIPIVTLDSTTREALKLLTDSKLPAMAVVDDEGNLVGMFEADHVRERLANIPNASLDDLFDRYVEKFKYYFVDPTDNDPPTLGRVSRILDIASYVVVVNYDYHTNGNKPVGIITTDDLLPILSNKMLNLVRAG